MMFRDTKKKTVISIRIHMLNVTYNAPEKNAPLILSSNEAMPNGAKTVFVTGDR